jgi:peptide/nickel transport system substrate-binding protein
VPFRSDLCLDRRAFSAGLLSATVAATAWPRAVWAAERDDAVVGLGSAPGPFDPATSPGVEQLIVVRPCYQTLVARRIDERGTLHFEPDLAASWEVSADGLAWTFRLQPDARFDDGTVVDAAAVKFSLDRLVALGRGPASLVKKVLSAVQAIDTRTVRLVLKQPTPLALLAASEKGAAIINPSIPGAADKDDWGSRWLATHTAGSGPWRLQPVAAKGLWTLERNPHAPRRETDHPIRLQRVQFRELRDPAVRLLALQKGDIDLAVAIAIQDLPAVQADPALKLLAGPVSAFSNLAMNTEAGPLRALALRRSVAQAIDPTAISRYLRSGRATPFLGPLPLGMAGAAPDSYTSRFDPAAARAAVAQAGAKGTRLDMVYPGLSQTTDTLAQYLQAVLADAGLAVRLQRLSLPAFIDRVGRGSYDLALMGWVVDSPDPASIANVWFGTDRIGAAGNYARFRDDEVQRLLDASLNTTDAALRARQIEQAVRRSNAAVPYVYLFQTHNWLVHRARLSGVAFDPWDLFRLRPEQWSWSAA